MRRIRCFRYACVLIPAVFAMVFCAAPGAYADSISFTLSSPTLTATSGGTVQFDGTITNDSGQDLDATDLFFNFFGYDPTSLTPNQDLGVVTDFTIPNSTTSVSTDLFSVVLGTVAAGSSFPIEVQLEDINGDLSAIETATVSVPGSVTPTPEPTSLLLLCCGLMGLIACRRFFGDGSRNSIASS